MKKIGLIITSIIIIVSILSIYNWNEIKNKEELKKQEQEQIEQQKQHTEDVNNHYAQYVKTTIKAELYKKENNNYKKIGTISSDVNLELESKENEYFKINESEYYIYYQNVTPISKPDQSKKFYERYLPFNENVVTEKTKLYQDEKLIYELEESINLPIIIKEEDRYYVEYKDQLFYVKKEEIKEIVPTINTTEEETMEIRTIVYHEFYDQTVTYCASIICHEKGQLESHVKYLHNNNYYALTMNDVNLFIDGKIRLPKKSVIITIDDGGDSIKNIAIPIFEKYKIHATLFLITGWYHANEYQSEYLELQSHSHNMHTTGVCPKGQGGGIQCLDRKTILNDLKTSKEILNGAIAFCYPFYEYNDYSIELLKEAGYLLAFNGDIAMVTQNTDKMEIPRYTLTSDTTVEDLKYIIN